MNPSFYFIVYIFAVVLAGVGRYAAVLEKRAESTSPPEFRGVFGYYRKLYYTLSFAACLVVCVGYFRKLPNLLLP